MVCCAENEDEETWPMAEATCRNCRNEWFWRRVNMNPIDREAFSAPPSRYKVIVDWEVRQAVDTFIDMGEGCISDVLCLAREKHWLRSNTKIAELLDQALAANRYARAESGYDGSEDELSGDDEDDPEYMSLTEDAGGIRELSITDWARNRILDGYWISPADQFYHHVLPGQLPIPAVHPCPWLGATYSGALVDGESAGDGEELEHPRPRTYQTPYPPTYQLCEAVHRTFQRVLREILLPAMVNITRRIVIECTADGTDPAQRALKMRLEDVVAELRDHATWTRGVDWLELRATRAREEQARRRRTGSEEDDASLSSRSEGSHTTSPVLSTTTLQTTPSPPPEKEDESVGSPTATAPSAMAVPTSPSLHMKELLRPVPYVPVSIAELPQYSYDCIKMIWREACAPLYHCRCSICERAILKANMETKAANESQNQQSTPPDQQRPVQIHIEDPAIIALREEEEEEDFDLDDGESEREDDAEDVEYDTLQQDLSDNPFYVASDAEAETRTEVTSETMSSPDAASDAISAWQTEQHTKGVHESGIQLQPQPQRTRKRSYDEDEVLDDAGIFALMGVQSRRTDGATTPPKRQRTAGAYTPTATATASPAKSRESLVGVAAPTPMRARKRSSEELEDADAREEAVAQTPGGKRVKASHGGGGEDDRS
ncbi:hypothetical protein EIP86_010180 [Pleurotus ostreatoroseus]|nr:hypothetical protein EIP86_010180 [Pleurotus ostreatoroseus]